MKGILSSQVAIIAFVAVLCYAPFINKALHIDADMLVHTSGQLRLDPLNPALGDYGRHMVLHDHTNMPQSSVWYRTGHPPLLPLVLAPIVAIAGNREWPLHAALFAFYLLSVFAVYRLLGLWYDSRYRFAGTLLWATCPVLLVNSSNIMWDVAITGLMLLSLLLFLSALRSGRLRWMLLSGVVAGLAALTKANALPLFLVCPVYLAVTKRWRALALWVLPAAALPAAWVVHNLVVYGKIHYLSVGWYSFLVGDIRYRLERDLSYFGGALVFPLFWVWLLIARKKMTELVIFLGLGGLWGILLIVILKRPVWFGAAYAVFAAAGAWLLYKMFLFFRGTKIGVYRTWEPKLIAAFTICNFGVLNILPSASMRYILPLVPFALLVIGEELMQMADRHRRIFLSVTIGAGALLSLCLSIGDYLQCEADRLLPKVLVEKTYGCKPSQTWYFGRMSYDWYLYHAGFRNLRADTARPRPGDLLVHELIPGDYNVDEMEKTCFRLEPVDTLRFFYWPFRTIGLGAGFYGEDRLPFIVRFGAPQKAYALYRLLPK